MPELSDAELDDLLTSIGLTATDPPPPVGRGRGGSRLQPIDHGTYRGAKQHRYRGEIPCDECRDAANTYQRARYARAGRTRR